MVVNRQMKSFARFILAATAGGMLIAAQAHESRAVLRLVEERLRPALAGLTPSPTVEYPEYSQSLLVCYRPQKFLVHGRSKSGEWSTNVVEQIGPSFTGFVLRVHLQSLGLVNQLVTPQAIQEPYWRTFLDVTPIAGTTNQIYWALSSAGRTDQKLLENVRQTLGSLAEPGPKSATNGETNERRPLRSVTNQTLMEATSGVGP